MLKNAAVLAVTMLILAAGSAQAGEACLRNNTIHMWRAVDGMAVLVIDEEMNVFRLVLAGACDRFANDVRRALAFTPQEPDGCIAPGDALRYRREALGRRSCRIADIQLESTASASN